MKTLEKKELKNVTGGLALYCSPSGLGTTHCYYINGNTQCWGDYGWDGSTIQLVCGNVN